MNLYEARHLGRTYCCDTEGSEHYKEGGVEPLDLLIAKGLIEDFCIGNMVKYATRFKITRNLVDLRKVSDYAHILCGVELGKDKPETVIPITEPLEMGEEDVSEEPVKGKYEGMTNEELHNRVCHSHTESCSSCIIPGFANGKGGGANCWKWEEKHPTLFRALAIPYLEGLEGKG